LNTILGEEITPIKSNESVMRAKIRDIVKDIEYGVFSKIFDFTIFNYDVETIFVQLKKVVEYCFQ